MSVEHKHEWKRTKRRHGRPPRFFVVCACGVTSQAVINFGLLHVFQTSKPRLNKNEIKKVRTFRASDNEIKMIENGDLRLTVTDGRVTIAV